MPRFALVSSCLSVLAALAGAQEREPHVADPDHPEREARVSGEDPPNALELAIGGDGVAFGYRSGLHRGDGYMEFAGFIGEDDDYAGHARLVRFGQPAADTPLGLGIGLGLFGAHVDDAHDEALAIPLTGVAEFALDEVFELTYPTRVGLEVSWAPDVTTFVDGTRVIDILARAEADLSGWATAFVGYRRLEVDLENESDAELDSAFQAGIRLGF